MERGHWLDAPRNDYGIDATMFHHDSQGRVENGEVRFQLKAAHALKVSRDGAWVSQRVESRDLRYWYFEFFPVIIVAYDADRDCAFWLHLQDYLDRNQELMESEADTVTLRIPARNRLNTRAIDHFRSLSLECSARLRKDVEDRP